MVACTVKLGKDQWTKWEVIRIEFILPADVLGLSYYGANDDRLTVHWLDAAKYPLSWFIGKTPLELVSKLILLRRAAGHGYSDVLNIWERYLKGELKPLYKRTTS